MGLLGLGVGILYQRRRAWVALQAPYKTAGIPPTPVSLATQAVYGASMPFYQPELARVEAFSSQVPLQPSVPPTAPTAPVVTGTYTSLSADAAWQQYQLDLAAYQAALLTYGTYGSASYDPEIARLLKAPTPPGTIESPIPVYYEPTPVVSTTTSGSIAPTPPAEPL